MPISVELQTDPIPHKHVSIQIENGEHVIPFVDRRSKSSPNLNYELIDDSLNENDLEVGERDRRILENKVKRPFSSNQPSRNNVGKDLSKTVIQKIITTADLHVVKNIDYKIFSKILNQLILNQDNFDAIGKQHSKERWKWEKLEMNLRMLIKYLKQEKQTLLKRIERVKFEKSWLESENFEIHDKLETLKLKVAQGEIDDIYEDKDFKLHHVDSDGKPKSSHPCHSLLKIIKEKKRSLLKLRMPKNTVKKIISKFDEFLSKNTEGSPTQLSEITYDSFMYKYGLQ